ncbi:MAG: Uma2 family endonuclease [Acidobacteriota bacterium]|nr:Uma2 family endonuclease [Acidobacteriota bacterium]
MSAVLEQTLEKTTMTADEFFDSPYSRGFELVRGKIVPKGGNFELNRPTGALHGVVTEELASRLSYFVRENKLGRVFAAETGFVLAEGTVRGADVAFVGQEKIAEFGISEKFFQAAPDLAVETISPGNSLDEIQDKIEEYLTAGTKLVWIVYPKQKMIQVHRQGNVINVLRENDTLDGEDVLPNFRVKLNEIFNY